jgi:hypothetical protein
VLEVLAGGVGVQVMAYDDIERDAIAGEGEPPSAAVQVRRLLNTPIEELREISSHETKGPAMRGALGEISRLGIFAPVAAICEQLQTSKEQALDLALKRSDYTRAAKIARELDALKQAAEFTGWPWTSASKLAEPLPEVPWVVEALELAPGLPTLFAGYGYSGKTVAAQSLALSVATGTRLWGRFPTKSGKVRHVDYEQGWRLTAERYQRLARAEGFNLLDVGDALSFVALPPDRLDDAAIEALLKRELTGVTLAIIDSFRAGAPTVDENDSKARIPLDMLGRVSEATGCTIVLLHHARKATEGDRDVRQILRGSSALFDACQCFWAFMGTKGTIVLENGKARLTGRTFEELSLTVVDVIGEDGNDRWGLRVRVDNAADARMESLQKEQRELAGRVIAFVRANPKCSSRRIRAGVVGGTNEILAALDKLETDGQVQNMATKGGARWVALT